MRRASIPLMALALSLALHLWLCSAPAHERGALARLGAPAAITLWVEREPGRQAGHSEPSVRPASAERAARRLRSPSRRAGTAPLSKAPSVNVPLPDLQPIAAQELRPAVVALRAHERAIDDSPHEPVDRSRSDRLSRELAASAAARLDLTPRGAPNLRRRSDGTYSWEGSSVSAVIAPDGTVAFRDRPAFEYDGIATFWNTRRNEVLERTIAPGLEDRFEPMAGGVRFRFDLSDLVGGDTYNSERAWFMQHTAALRRVLALGRELCSTADLTKLEQHLRTIVRDSQRSAEQRRRALFDVHDACSQQIAARAACARIAETVRAAFPEGSEQGYRSEELAELNRTRSGPTEFQPYRQK